MKGRRWFSTIQVKLIAIYMLLILIAIQLIAVYFVSTVKSSLTDTFTNSLNDQARALAVLASDKLAEGALASGNAPEGDSISLSEYVNNLFSRSGAELQVLDTSGRVLATSEAYSALIGKKNTSQMVSQALQGIPDNEQDILDEDNVRKKIITQPIKSPDNRVIGAVYIVAQMTEVNATVGRVNQIFVSGTLIALGLTGVLGIILAHTITSPIKGLTRQAEAVAEGRFDQQVPVLADDEIGRLSEAFNEMTKRLREALSVNEEENEKLQSVLSNMSDGVIAADEHGTVMVSNRRALELLGVEECEGCRLTDVLELPQERLEALRGTRGLAAVLMKESPDGEERWVLRVTLSPINRRGNGITGTIAVLQDITEQEKLDQSRREFVANVSHELRTPLTTIRSYAEALDDGALGEPELSGRFVGVIRNETERMIRLVTDLLHLSRLDSQQSTLRRRETDIAEMLDEVADRFSVQMRKKGIRAVVQVDKRVGQAVLDRDQIDQVLDNLMSNAIKYTLEGGRIELSARLQEGGALAVSVKDSGIGIPKRDLSRIFDRFYRVDKARSREMGGTGLGLSIAREMIKAHGGTITLESELDVGTTVTFILPQVQEKGELA
ncbi:cell wall metabolism sensor histidine kinase WalK [Paenibacillus pasadenensis]|uniref:cell wall metabolism sensor histidine kinase WalK n=1 Tax=Paenibacillus pasadenensis TaxID=217090 RepID=UPI0020419910|nr:cell wall metabolism sensor histidine kinase WalK [Paenibacillus pasadenensis]MCM3747921.1 cell wall metabolism sensor histidine kinase WalK [Paenibacillus pasadenensis]